MNDLTNADTRWVVWTLPGGETLIDLKAKALLLTLSVPSNDPDVLAAVENAASRAGMTLTRLTNDHEED